MTIFITGGSGFVGRAMQRAARNHRWPEVVAIPRVDAAAFLRTRTASAPHSATVIHLAWPSLPEGRPAPRAAADRWRDFLDWSVALREVAAEAGAWFIGVGSGIETCAADLSAKLGEPYLSYARQKTELMQALLRAEPSRLSWVRLHFMFGPFENPRRIVPSAVAACLDGTELTCGRRDRRRRWLHVDDTAELLRDFTAAPVAGDWDIAGRQDLSFDELLGLVARAVGKPLRLSPIETSNADSNVDIVEPAKLAAIVPEAAGRPENLVVRLEEYARWIAGRGRSETSKVTGRSDGQRA